MPIVKYWTKEKKAKLLEMIKERRSLREIHEEFPVSNVMSIIFQARELSPLGNVPSKYEEGIAKVIDQTKSKREAYSDSNLTWTDGDNIRLKRYFAQTMSIKDVHLRMGRTYNAVVQQMSKLYPTMADKERLFSEICLYITHKSLGPSKV